MEEMPRAEGLQVPKAEIRTASPDRMVNIGTPTENVNEEAIAMKKANRALQTARFSAIDELMRKKGDELAVAMVAGDDVKVSELRAGIKALEEQKNKAADRLVGAVEKGVDTAQ